ncbi:MAG: dienelactone hydrolase family protein [Pseudomonadota bacterium]
MTMLDGERVEAQSETPTSAIIFLHGYGANGADLIGLSQPLAEHLPETVFFAPNAPERCANNPMGFQWFPIPWLDGSSEAEMAVSFGAATGALGGYLDEIESSTGLGPERIVLVGFSQGTMMSLHVGLRRPVACAGIVGFSGRLLQPERLAAEITVRPPVLLVHGEMDDVVPFSDMEAARAGLAEVGLEAETHASPGIGHGIAPDGLSRALQFIQARASL